MKKVFLATILIVSVLMFTGCKERKYDKVEKEKLPVLATKVKKGEISKLIYATGNILPEENIQVSTKLMGEILNIPFDKGDSVKKGDLILEIDSMDVVSKKNQALGAVDEGNANLKKLEAARKEAEAALKNININYDRMDSLYKKGSIDKKNYDDVKMNLDIAKAKLEGLEAEKLIVQARIKTAKAMADEADANLKYAKIYAPFDGIITRKYKDKGNISSPGHPVLELQKLDRVKVDLNVSELDINEISVGNVVNIFVDALSVSFKSEITAVVPSADMGSRSFVVRALLENKKGLLKSGMFVKGEIITVNKKNVLTISREALIESSGDFICFEIVNDTAVQRKIKVGVINENMVEVTNGLKENSVIVTSGKQNVTQGTFVRIVKEEDIKKFGTL